MSGNEMFEKMTKSKIGKASLDKLNKIFQISSIIPKKREKTIIPFRSKCKRLKDKKYIRKKKNLRMIPKIED